MSQAINEEQPRDHASPAVDHGIDPAASIKYWNSVPPTANGMLAALGGIHGTRELTCEGLSPS